METNNNITDAAKEAMKDFVFRATKYVMECVVEFENMEEGDLGFGHGISGTSTDTISVQEMTPINKILFNRVLRAFQEAYPMLEMTVSYDYVLAFVVSIEYKKPHAQEGDCFDLINEVLGQQGVEMTEAEYEAKDE
jgi:hypothetical protein